MSLKITQDEILLRITKYFFQNNWIFHSIELLLIIVAVFLLIKGKPKLSFATITLFIVLSAIEFLRFYYCDYWSGSYENNLRSFFEDTNPLLWLTNWFLLGKLIIAMILYYFTLLHKQRKTVAFAEPVYKQKVGNNQSTQDG